MNNSTNTVLEPKTVKDKYPEGGEIIVPPLTWVSDITAVKMNGFTPVFADISMKTLSLDTEKILLKINMENRRQQKIAKVIKQDLAILFQREARNLFNGAFITVTTVSITADMSYAKVYLSIMGNNENNVLSLTSLGKSPL